MEENVEKKSFKLLPVNWNKNPFWIFIVVGILILIIIMPFDKFEKKQSESVLYPQIQSDENIHSDSPKTEEKLEEILSKIEGVGNVKVMITYKQNQSSGNVLSDSFYYRSNESEQEITVSDVEGVLIVCEGGNRPETIELISETIQALFPVDVHKIKVTRLRKSN